MQRDGMKFTIAREQLQEGLAAVAAAIPAKTTLPVLANVLVEASKQGLRSKVRTKTLTIPRQVAMYLARNMLGMQLVEIGQAFGGRDHSTVIHSVDKVERQMIRDRTFKERVEMARQELSAL